MHRGVREFIRWIQANRDAVEVEKPAAAKDVTALEHQLGAPLPADLKLVLGVFDGGQLPSGMMLSAKPGPGNTMESALKEIAEDYDVSFLDPELLLPFHRTEAGSYLAFDRSAAPVSDTWPVVDYDLESGEMRITHRTFDGWCRLCVAEWSAPSYTGDFTIEKYLEQGKRHAEIEPDVSIAHVTVAHALRRCGEPELALESYLRGGRCVPSVAWSDWEALKLATVLRYPADALEAGARLGKRAPASMWERRETTPSRVAYALATVCPPPGEAQEPWLRIFDNLVGQAIDDADKNAASAIRAAVVNASPVPPPDPPQESEVVVGSDLEATWNQMVEAYKLGALRDDDLALNSAFAAILRTHDLADILRIRRDF